MERQSEGVGANSGILDTQLKRPTAGHFSSPLMLLAHRAHRMEPATSEHVCLFFLNPDLFVATRLEKLYGAPLPRHLW